MLDITKDLMASEIFYVKYSDNNTETFEQMLDRIYTTFLDKEVERFKKLYALKEIDPKIFNQKVNFGLSLSGFIYYNILVSIPTFDEDCVREHLIPFFEPILKTKPYIIPGGSVMEGIGGDKYISLSNCFVNESPGDSIENIYHVSHTSSELMKRRGGVGYDLSTIRPKGAPVNNSSRYSTGIVPFMEKYSNDTGVIAQDGRRGALLMSLSVIHPDIYDFIEVKQNLSKVNNANISVKITNEFMEAVVKDEDFILKWPINQDLSYFSKEYLDGPYNTLIYLEDHKKDNKVFYIKKVRARELWDRIIKSAWTSGEPGILFEDAHIYNSPDGVYDEYRMVSTNPCGEIGMQPFDSCRLIHHILTSWIEDLHINESLTKHNYNLLNMTFYMGLVINDILVDLEIERVDKILGKLRKEHLEKSKEFELWEKIRKTASSSRRCGTGFTGLFDFAILQLYKSGNVVTMDKIQLITKMIMQKKLEFELDATIDLAILYEPFEGWDATKEFNTDGTGKNLFYQRMKEIYPAKMHRMKMYGRRNVSFNTVAPTGSVSILAGCTSGIEPLFLPIYKRKRKITDNSPYSFVDENGIKFMEYIVVHRQLKHWIESTYKLENIEETLSYGEIEEYYEKSPWFGFSANDITIEDRLKLQSIVQDYTTHSISSTINLPKTATQKEINDLYLSAWHNNLKGITVYRDGCRAGILTAVDDFVQAVRPERPEKLNSKMFILTKGGVKYGIIIGLLKNRPYEIFAVTLDKNIRLNRIDGITTKTKRGNYKFTSSEMNIDNLQLQFNSTEERLAIVFASISLGHGIPINYIIKTLDKIDDNISSFSKAIQRVLSNFIEKEELTEKCPECGGTLVKENGCTHCIDCTYSRC